MARSLSSTEGAHRIVRRVRPARVDGAAAPPPQEETMATSSSRTKLPGTKREALQDAKSLGPITPDERFEVTVRVRRAKPLDLAAAASDTHADRQYVRREDY